MEGKEESKRGEQISLSQILLSKNNPFASSSKFKSSLEQSNKRHVGPSSKYEFVRIVPDNPAKHESGQKIKVRKKRRVADIGYNHSKIVSSRAAEKAKEVEASLSREHPSFIKPMRKSHVSNTFLLRLPQQFCNLHFPTSEITLLVLEGENGKHYKTKYLPHCCSLSGGWKRFSVSQNLQENDVLVFHLVQPRKLKVHILRASDYDPVEKDHTIPKSRDVNLDNKEANQKTKLHSPAVETNIYQEDFETNTTTERHNLPLNIMFSKTISSFKNFKITMENHDPVPDDMFSDNISSFKNFKIVVDNKTLDNDIPQHIRDGYYVLCRARKMLLHRNLIKGINPKLAASIISETMNIADAITNSTMSIPREDIAYWHTALQSFEFIGMDVEFIRARLNRLLGITRECSNAVTNWKKNKVAKENLNVAHIEEEIRECENKIKELEILKRGLEFGNREYMDEIADKFKVMYTKEAKAPW